MATFRLIPSDQPMPTIAIPCSACGRKLNVPQERVGTQADCPACKTKITLDQQPATVTAAVIQVDDLTNAIPPKAAPKIARPIATPVAKRIGTPIAKPIDTPIATPAAPPIVALVAEPQLAEPQIAEPATSPFALNVSATPARGAVKSAQVAVAVKPMPVAPPWLPKLIVATAAVVVLSGLIGSIVIGKPNSLISCTLWAAVGGGLFAARGFLGKWPTKPVAKLKLESKHYIISGLCIIGTFGFLLYAYQHRRSNPELFASIPLIMVGLGLVASVKKWYRQFVNLALRFGSLQVASFAYVGLSVLLLGSLVSVLANRPDLKNQAEFSGASTSVDPETLELALREQANSKPTSVVPAQGPAQSNVSRNGAANSQPQSQSASPAAGRSAADIARQLAAERDAEREARSGNSSPFGPTHAMSNGFSNGFTNGLANRGTSSGGSSPASARPPRVELPPEFGTPNGGIVVPGEIENRMPITSSGISDRMWQSFSKRHGEQSVAKVVVHGLPAGLRYSVAVAEKLAENSDARNRYSLSNTSTQVVLSNVTDLKAFAAKVDFATLTSIDEASRTITLQADAAKVLKLYEERSTIRKK
jgi:DNA-directed RNA polymerase subunit RPC12/RpoP